MDAVLERLIPLFRDVFANRRLVITAASNADTIPNYDSLMHINIISAVEQEFAVSFNLDELLGLGSVGDLIALLERKSSS